MLALFSEGWTMNDVDRHQRRADDMADAMRRYLVGVNAGGVGVLAALANSEAGASSELPSWVIAPIVCFVAGLILTGVSLSLQKHKAQKRRDAAKRGEPEPDFNTPGWRNEWLDQVSLATFVLGTFLFVALRFSASAPS
jgi:hypothetical protein